jgi:hypothetical protein
MSFHKFIALEREEHQEFGTEYATGGTFTPLQEFSPATSPCRCSIQRSRASMLPVMRLIS